ncbi:diguanylate cyclase [Hyphomonas sp.]|jgi:diguanylate cyclase (GGDEF)-like protein|uniref:diguanylate cyclase n=2 Tax=Hyphomonas sp. TaxID=87 RepID=UPI003567042B
MTEEFHQVSQDQRRALLDILGVDLDALGLRERAALEALSEEVIALRNEAARLRIELSDAELLADNDALCPIFNRRAFEREVRREIALADRFRTPLSLIFIDLDHFKKVNDAFGHAAGDDVLMRVSDILLQNTRETDIVGRLGGDEFGVVLAQASHADTIAKAAQLTTLIDQLVVCNGDAEHVAPVHIGASCGIAKWQEGQGADTLIALGDQDMFAQKARRKCARPLHV